jgi:hypothetical protein
MKLNLRDYMDRTFSTHGREMLTKIRPQEVKHERRDRLKDFGVDGRIKLKKKYMKTYDREV